MRVLMLSDFYRPLLGGTERLVADLSHDLAARGHEVAVATLAHPDAPAREDEAGVAIFRLAGLAQQSGAFSKDPRRRFTPPLPDPLLARALDAVVAEWRPDLIHAHGWIVYSALPRKRRWGVPLVVTLHDYGHFCAHRDLLYKGETICTGPALPKCLACQRVVVGLPKAAVLVGGLAVGRRWHGAADRFVAISNYVAEQSAGRVAPRGTIPVIPSFIADSVPDYQPPATRSPELPAGGYLLYVGALNRNKGVDLLLAAHAALPAAPPLVLIGSSLGTPPWGDGAPPAGVTVIRDAPHPLVLEAWAGCRIGVVPSRWAEPLGLVALEALALGKPLVAARIGGLTDIVEDGRTGLLVPPGDPLALRDAIASLLAEPAHGARLGAAGRQLVRERFTASAVVPQLEALYAEVAEVANATSAPDRPARTPERLSSESLRP